VNVNGDNCRPQGQREYFILGDVQEVGVTRILKVQARF
jgi:hypothetical protein